MPTQQVDVERVGSDTVLVETTDDGGTDARRWFYRNGTTLYYSSEVVMPEEDRRLFVEPENMILPERVEDALQGKGFTVRGYYEGNVDE